MMFEGPKLPGDADLIWVGDMTRAAASRYPERAAIVMPESGETLSYAELEHHIGRALWLLREQGLQPGARIAYLGKNHWFFYVLMFAAIRGGYVLAPLNWRCTAVEIGYFLDDSGAALLFCDNAFFAVAEEAMKGLATPPRLFANGGDDGDSSSFFRATISSGERTGDDSTQQDGVCLLLYTSGTTGRPKGVLSTHRVLSLCRQAELVYPDFPDWRDGSVVCAMPHFHIAGIAWLHMGLIRHSTCVLTNDPSGPNMLKLIREHDAVAIFAVPTVVRAIVEALKQRGETLSSLKYIFYGSAPIGQSLLKATMEVLDCGFGQFYGMTEITGSATFLHPGGHDLARPELMASVGKPLPGTALDVRDAEGRSLPSGQSGEIWIRTDTLMVEYLDKPEETAKAVVDGWYRSGDGGYLNDEGYLFLTDRIKDIIVSGGENIYPAEVEDAVRQFPPVLDVAVVARPDDRWGEAVMAVVESRPEQTIDEQALIDFVRTRIAGYKCPKSVVVLDSLPRTASGKVQRVNARTMALDLLAGQGQ